MECLLCLRYSGSTKSNMLNTHWKNVCFQGAYSLIEMQGVGIKKLTTLKEHIISSVEECF